MAATVLTGCASSTSAVTDSVRLLMAPPAADTAVLNPDLRYLRVTSNKNVAMLALGYVDAMPQPDTQVWYSAKKETVRLWRGRIIGTAGLKVDWRSVRFGEVPSWRSAIAGNAHYQRSRDVMPDYLVDVREEVLIRPVAPPKSSAFIGPSATDLHWFEETTTTHNRATALPVARFAVDLSGADERVVYSEQCLSATLCMTLQDWSSGNSPSSTTSLLR